MHGTICAQPKQIADTLAETVKHAKYFRSIQDSEIIMP